MEAIPLVVERPASAHGWVCRPDIGPDVWEMPDGRLYIARPDESVPMILSFSGLSLRDEDEAV